MYFRNPPPPFPTSPQYAGAVCPAIVPDEALEIAWVTAKFYMSKATGEKFDANKITNQAYVATYGDVAPYPIPENFEQIANCQGWADAWLRMYFHLKHNLANSQGATPASAASTTTRRQARHVQRHLKAARYGKLSKPLHVAETPWRSTPKTGNGFRYGGDAASMLRTGVWSPVTTRGTPARTLPSIRSRRPSTRLWCFSSLSR